MLNIFFVGNVNKISTEVEINEERELVEQSFPSKTNFSRTLSAPK